MPLSIRTLCLLMLAGGLFAMLFTNSSAEPPRQNGSPQPFDLADPQPSYESQYANESQPSHEPQPAYESQPAYQSQPAIESLPAGQFEQASGVPVVAGKRSGARPRSQLRSLEMPPGFEPQRDAEPLPNALKAFQAIQGALENESWAGSTGNPMLDDILGVAREISPVVHRFPSEQLLDEDLNRPAVSEQASRGSRKALAAEHLLRAARLLERDSENGPDQVDLIQQMRSEAKRLLSE